MGNQTARLVISSIGDLGDKDHGLLTGLLVDDHTQYALADKSRPTPWVSASDLSSLSLADLGTKDHNLLTDLLADDHTQYALADKSRPTPWVSAGDLSALSIADLGTKDHNLLTDLLADDHTQYALADKSRPTPWVAAGDLSGLSIADLGTKDHDLLDGLLDDDHTQYALADKSRPTPWVAAGDLSALSIADLGTKDHDLLTGLLDDDHTQYALADKSRPTPWVSAGDLSGLSIADLGTKDHDLLDGLSDDDHPNNLYQPGRAGGQIVYGGTGAGDDLTLKTTSNATKGNIFIGEASTYEDNGTGPRLGIGTLSPSEPVHAYWDIDGNVGLRMENPNTGPSAVARLIADVDAGAAFLTAYGSGFTASGSKQPSGGGLIASNGLPGGLSIVAKNAAAELRFYAGGDTDTDEHLRITPAGELIVPQATGLIAGGTAASEELILRGTTNANLGLVRFQSPLIIDGIMTGAAKYAIDYSAAETASGFFIGGGLNLSPIISNTGTLIWQGVTGNPQITSNAAPGFGAFVLFSAGPSMISSASFDPLGAVILLVLAQVINGFSGTRTSSGVVGLSFTPSVRATASGAVMNCTGLTAVTCRPSYRTIAGSTSSLGTVRGLLCQNPTASGTDAGTESMTAFIGVDMEAVAFGGNVEKVALKSALTIASNSYFLRNIGGAKSDFGTGEILHGTRRSAEGVDNFPSYTPAALSADANNYSAYNTGTSMRQVSRVSAATADRTITGIAVQKAADTVYLVNVGTTYNIILGHLDSGSTVFYQIISPTGADITLGPNEYAFLWYDDVSSKWRVLDTNGA